jgi:hypothetical protein
MALLRFDCCSKCRRPTGKGGLVPSIPWNDVVKTFCACCPPESITLRLKTESDNHHETDRASSSNNASQAAAMFRNNLVKNDAAKKAIIEWHCPICAASGDHYLLV